MYTDPSLALKGNGYTFRGSNSLKVVFASLFAFRADPFSVKGKNLLSLGSKFFAFRVPVDRIS